MNKLILDDEFNQDKDNFTTKEVRRINLLKIEINDCIKKIKTARTVLIILVVLNIFFTIIQMQGTTDPNLIEGAILETMLRTVLYSLCAFGVRYLPKTALITSLSIYLIIILLTALVDPRTISHGILLKVVVIFSLVRGIRALYQMGRYKKELQSLGVDALELKAIKRLKDLPKTPYPEK